MEISEQCAGVSSPFPSHGNETEQGFKACQQVPVPAEQAQCPSVCVYTHANKHIYACIFMYVCQSGLLFDVLLPF